MLTHPGPFIANTYNVHDAVSMLSSKSKVSW